MGDLLRETHSAKLRNMVNMTRVKNRGENSNVNIVQNDLFAKKKNYVMNALTPMIENTNAAFATYDFYELTTGRAMKRPILTSNGLNANRATNLFVGKTSLTATASEKFARPTKSKVRNEPRNVVSKENFCPFYCQTARLVQFICLYTIQKLHSVKLKDSSKF